MTFFQHCKVVFKLPSCLFGVLSGSPHGVLSGSQLPHEQGTPVFVSQGTTRLQIPTLLLSPFWLASNCKMRGMDSWFIHLFSQFLYSMCQALLLMKSPKSLLSFYDFSMRFLWVHLVLVSFFLRNIFLFWLGSEFRGPKWIFRPMIQQIASALCDFLPLRVSFESHLLFLFNMVILCSVFLYLPF